MENIKMQLNEFCQKCQNIQNISGTSVVTGQKNTDGETIDIITVSYHCEACHTFVRSEEHEKLREISNN